MRGISIEERATKLAHYIIETKETVRSTAKTFGISKSTVHKDVSERLLKINPSLAKEVRIILETDKTNCEFTDINLPFLGKFIFNKKQNDIIYERFKIKKNSTN